MVHVSLKHNLLEQLLDCFEVKFTRGKWATITQGSPDTALRNITIYSRSVLLKWMREGAASGMGK